MELITFMGHGDSRVTRLKVRKNELVAKDQIILLYEPSPGSDPSKFEYGDGKVRAKFMGCVVEFLVKEGDTIQHGTPLLSMKKGCSHPVLIKDMCADCGTDLRKDGQLGVRTENVTASVPMVHSIPELIVSNEQAAKLGQDDVTRMLKARRLALLVDLDQTLIHTTTENVSNQITDIHHFQLYGPRTPWYHTKLRPGTAEFLAEVRKYYELHICTFGTRMYAHQIAKILDPDGALFSHRILSRDEFLDPSLKTANMKALFPCGDQMVCIIDDREDVWNYSPNLVHVKPYHYFKNVGDINAPFPKITPKNFRPPTDKPAPKDKSTDQTEASSSNGNGETLLPPLRPPSEAVKHQYESRFGDEGQEESDDYLLYLRQILMTIHDAFYQLYDENVERSDDSLEGSLSDKKEPDLKNIIPYVRKKVLKGCNLVFTGLFPHDVLSDEKSKALALAKSFGAEVTDDLVTREEDAVNFTTHLIAAKDGTVKVTTARKAGYISIVAPDWLTECIRRWERVEERLFPLVEGTKGSEAFLRNAAFHHGQGRPAASNSASSEAPATSGEQRPRTTSITCLSGISADVLHTMEDEIDDAINSENDENSSEEGKAEEVFTATESRKRKRGDEDFELESGDEDEKEAKHLKRDLEVDSEDEDEKEAGNLKSEDLTLSNSSSDSSSESHTFSDDDDNTLGELARDLDRQLSESDPPAD